ncbi:MAG TPA: hypothetical protein VFZ68_04535 [Acidimicrobiales bacterium]
MPDRLTPVAAIAGVACCVSTAIAAVLVGGVTLASLGRFGLVSGSALVILIALAWRIDHRRADNRRHDLIEERP